MSRVGKITREICSSNSGLSSKRVAGIVGFSVCLCCLIYETIMMGDQLPNGYDVTLITSASLLGVDSIAKAFYKAPKAASIVEDNDKNNFDRPKIMIDE